MLILPVPKHKFQAREIEKERKYKSKTHHTLDACPISMIVLVHEIVVVLHCLK